VRDFRERECVGEIIKGGKEEREKAVDGLGGGRTV